MAISTPFSKDILSDGHRIHYGWLQSRGLAGGQRTGAGGASNAYCPNCDGKLPHAESERFWCGVSPEIKRPTGRFVRFDKSNAALTSQVSAALL